ncbi:GerAB/ArcD/ProY family transporter [Acidaminobacterium chupaoyuni]
MERTSLSSHAMFCLLTLFCVGNASVLSSLPLRDGWAAFLLGALLFLPLLFCLFSLTKNCSSLQDVFAPLPAFLKGFFRLFLGLAALGSSVLSLRITLCFLAESSLPATQPSLIAFFLLSTMLLFQRSGLHAMGRAAQMVFPVIFSILVVSLVISVPQFDLTHLLPLFQSPQKLARPSVSLLFFPYCELIYPMLLFFPLTLRQPRKQAVGAVLFAAGMLSLIFAKNLVVLGLPALKSYYFPSYAVAGLVSLGNFFQRFEVFVLSFYLLSRFSKTTITFAFTSQALAPLLHLSPEKVSLLQLPLLFALPLFIFPSSASLFAFLDRFPLTYGWIAPLGLAVMWAICLSLKKRAQKKND